MLYLVNRSWPLEIGLIFTAFNSKSLLPVLPKFDKLFLAVKFHLCGWPLPCPEHYYGLFSLKAVYKNKPINQNKPMLP